MRLVWIVIPLVLIGIIGIQEADAQCCLGMAPIYSSELTISNPPKLYDTIEVTLLQTYIGESERPGHLHTSGINLHQGGFDLVSGNVEKIQFWKAGEILEHKITIRAMEVGNWTISGGSAFGGFDRIGITVSENDSYLSDKPFRINSASYQEKSFRITPEYLNKHEGIQRLYPEVMPEYDYRRPPPLNTTVWNQDLEIRPTELILGETANYTVTVYPNEWPPKIDGKYDHVGFHLRVYSNSIVTDGSITEYYDSVKDSYYYTFTGTLTPLEHSGEIKVKLSKKFGIDPPSKWIKVSYNQTDYLNHLEENKDMVNNNDVLFVGLFSIIGVGLFTVMYLGLKKSDKSTKSLNPSSGD